VDGTANTVNGTLVRSTVSTDSSDANGIGTRFNAPATQPDFWLCIPAQAELPRQYCYSV
jgi:hypothetical protein